MGKTSTPIESTHQGPSNSIYYAQIHKEDQKLWPLEVGVVNKRGPSTRHPMLGIRGTLD